MQEEMKQVHNVQVQVMNDTVVEILAVKQMDVDSTATYFYDILETECKKQNVDFGSLMVCLLVQNISTDKLINFVD